ncbi:hypothetical protein GCHA_1410 [Paraglaciecola chathamensis S18K6]|uniref:Uncharacterized protein n=1 Tax=Paraglaciecola chathamensis S18K6 TaxID=1127672 RepID=A0AAV3UWN6_9ALTE|nr:hypothetical protein GCHA_1410 [Paraglaciecola chathamensis S18K6]
MIILGHSKSFWHITPQSEAKNSWLKLATQEQSQLFFVLLN